MGGGGKETYGDEIKKCRKLFLGKKEMLKEWQRNGGMEERLAYQKAKKEAKINVVKDKSRNRILG